MRLINLKRYVHFINKRKPIFTPGPPSISIENFTGLSPAFGRGDFDYKKKSSAVIDWLCKLTGKSKIIAFQGSGSLACEIAINSFLSGKILVIKSGFYSDRLHKMVLQKHDANLVKYLELSDLQSLDGNFQWIVACYVETSKALKVDVENLKKVALKWNSRILLDATASIGLEPNHQLADVLCFSSCKGLFGFTGAAFLAYDENISIESNSEFYMNIETHINQLITGPYHAILSLFNIIPVHHQMVNAVKLNKEIFLKKYEKYLVNYYENEPLIATLVSCKLTSVNKNAVLYSPRSITKGSIVSHLGESYLKDKAKGKIIHFLKVEEV